MKNAELTNGHGIPYAMSNALLGYVNTVYDIYDAVEESETGAELVKALKKLHLRYDFRLDRETERYVRLVYVDRLGNRRYLTCEK